MTHTEKTARIHANNTAFLAKVFGVDVITFEGYQADKGLQFLHRQCTLNNYTDSYYHELAASKVFWRWFMYQCKLIDTRFLTIQVDLVMQYNNGADAAIETMPLAYRAWINNELKRGEFMAHAYANFIGEYIDSLQPSNKPIKRK